MNFFRLPHIKAQNNSLKKLFEIYSILNIGISVNRILNHNIIR